MVMLGVVSKIKLYRFCGKTKNVGEMAQAFFEECKLKMVEEMMPKKVSVFKNVRRYGHSRRDTLYFKERIISDMRTSA